MCFSLFIPSRRRQESRADGGLAVEGKSPTPAGRVQRQAKAGQPRFLATAVLSIALLPTSTPLFAQGTGADWPSYGGTHAAWRYSKLDGINTANVRKLVPVWAFQTGDYENGLQATPIVIDGVMYLSTSRNWVYALNAATGKIVWRYQYGESALRWRSEGKARVPYTSQNRGVAVAHGLVFMGTHDNHLVAVDQNTGREVWNVAVGDIKQCGCNISAAPLVVKDKVVVGGTGGDSAYRGNLTAFDAKTGRFAWRFYTIPGPGESGHETWSGDSWKYGGGAPWMTGSYDPELNLIYWGTGNAAADLDGAARKGDNLYTASVVALDADSGKLKWYYQEVPHDQWDYDAAYECILVDLAVRGRVRKLLVHLTKTGYTFVLDRTNGEIVKIWPFGEGMNWVQGITEDGKLVGRNEPKPGKPTLICPSVYGAKSWNQAAFSPRSGLLFTPTAQLCNEMFVRAQPPKEGKPYSGGFWRFKKPEGVENFASIAAFDPLTGEKRWEYPYKYLLAASVLATAGDLIFSGDVEGAFFALDARSGEKLWSFQTGSGHRGSSVSYAVGGRQYVATPSGWGSYAKTLLSLFPELTAIGGGRGGATLYAFALPEELE